MNVPEMRALLKTESSGLGLMSPELGLGFTSSSASRSNQGGGLSWR